MGSSCCPCCPEDSTTKAIDRQMRRGGAEDEELIKLLFLGAGGSGKSTLFKQLKLLHGNGLKEDERVGYRGNIYRNIVDGMKMLIEGNAMFMDDDEHKQAGSSYKFSGAERQSVKVKPPLTLCEKTLATYIEDLDDTVVISPKIAEKLKKAWNDPGISETWKRRSTLQVQESLKYFIENIDRIATSRYIPSVDDVMHVRVKTTGIVEESLTMQERNFKIVDVGGQRSERRKWLNCFSGVTGLIFVASLTAYNQYLYEDEKVNRLDESLMLFKKLLNEDDTFEKTCVVLFLNKDDLFVEMVKDTPITKALPNYDGGQSDVDQYRYIENLYKEEAKDRKVYCHRTCATNTDKMKVIFKSVNHAVINRALIKAGLLPEQ